MKLHEAQLSAILPSSLQRVEFIPKFHSCLCYQNLILLLILMKSKYVIFKLASTMSSGFLLLPASRDGSCSSLFVCA